MFVAATPGSLDEVTHYSRSLAGAETNVATGLARLGHGAGWIGRVGDDPFGRFIHTALSGTGIDTQHVSIDREAPTGFQLKIARRRRRPGGRLLPEELRRIQARLGPGARVLHRRRPAPARHRDPAGAVREHPRLRLPRGACRPRARRDGVLRHQPAAGAVGVDPGDDRRHAPDGPARRPGAPRGQRRSGAARHQGPGGDRADLPGHGCLHRRGQGRRQRRHPADQGRDAAPQGVSGQRRRHRRRR